ncbi:MAG: OmpA family protein [Kiritimatiellae bacterium]|nr:OmpA family protein [Kiritimatiellia bacterium]
MARTPKSILTAVILWVVIIAGIAAAVRYFVLPGYQKTQRDALAAQTGSEGRYKHAVRLAADSFSGYCLLRSPALAEGLSREGIKLSVVDDGADYMQRMDALSRGDVEMAVFPVNSFIQCGAPRGEFPATIVYILDETKGADAIIAYKDSVGRIDDLNSPHARIVLTPDSPSEFLARVMIASFNLPRLPRKTWMVKANGSSAVYKKFRADSRANPVAYAMWEPDVSRALSDRNAHVLLDSSKVKGYIVDALVVRREFLVDRYEVAKSVVENYARVAYANRDKMVETVMADARLLGDSLDEPSAARLVRGIEWKNTVENYAHFGLTRDAGSIENIEDIIIKIADVLAKTGVCEGNPLSGGANSLYFTRLVQEMKAGNFHPGRAVNVITGMDLVGTDEEVRVAGAAVKLTPAQWDSLTSVGELRVEPILFGRGTSRINVQSLHALEALASTLNSWPQYYLTVIGRVRPGGDAEAAMRLAKARAEATVQVLLGKGVAAERMRAVAEIGASDSPSAQSVSFVVGQMPY